MQWYEYVPGVLNTKVKDLPGLSEPESHTPLSLVQVWVGESWFVVVTAVPAATSSTAGIKVKFWMVMAAVGWPPAAVVVVMGRAVVVVAGRAVVVGLAVLPAGRAVVAVDCLAAVVLDAAPAAAGLVEVVDDALRSEVEVVALAPVAPTCLLPPPPLHAPAVTTTATATQRLSASVRLRLPRPMPLHTSEGRRGIARFIEFGEPVEARSGETGC